MKNFLNSYFVYFTIIIYMKFLYLRFILFGEFDFLRTLWFEMVVVLALLLVFEFFSKKIKLSFYILTNLIFSILFFSIVVYYKYFETVPSYFDLEQTNQIASVGGSIVVLLSIKDFLFFIDIPLIIILLFSKRFNYPLSLDFRRGILAISILTFLIISSVNFTLNKNKQILDMNTYVKDYGLVNTQMIQAYANSNSGKKARLSSFTSGESEFTIEDILMLKGNEAVPYEDQEFFGVAEDKNLIVIQIESLQNLVVNLEVNEQEVTPNINEWIKESLYFTNVYQQIGAGNTSDAEFMMNTSLYPIGNRPTSNALPEHDVVSLPKTLENEGYFTSTFHANEIEYWNRIELYPFLGFNQYYDLDFFGEEDVIGLGPSDEVLYDKSFEKLVRFKEEHDNFYAMINSMTSHSPFEMPENKEMLDLPLEYEGTLFGDYLQSVRYADHTLGLFFKKLKKSGLWDDTIIALYGDHSGLHGSLLTDQDVGLLRDLLGSYSLMQRFNVPFIIGTPGLPKGGREIDVLGGHIDMMPTVLNLLGIVPPELVFGHNLLEYDNNLIGMRYYLPTGSFLNNDVLYITENANYDVRVYDLATNKMISQKIDNPKQRYSKEFEKILQMYNWSDYFLLEGKTEF